MIVCGYAVTFGEIAFADGVHEFCTQNTFAEFVAARPRVALLFGSHDGWTIADEVELCNDSCGLGFRAKVGERFAIAGKC